jgi:hypothetical protein
MNFGRSQISKGKRKRKKRKMGSGAVFGLFNAEGRPAHELLVGRPIVWPGQWIVFVQKSRAFLQEIMRGEVGLRVVFCQSSRTFSQNGLGLADLGRPRARSDGRGTLATWPRIGRSRSSARPIRRPRDAGDVATLVGPLLLRESYIEMCSRFQISSRSSLLNS